MRPPWDKTIPPAFKWVLIFATILWVATLSTAAQIFTNTNSGLRPVNSNSVVQVDFDNDGKMDLLINGDNFYGPFATIWRDLGSGGFNDYAELNGPDLNSMGTYSGQVAAGDFYNTGRLDAVVTGIGSDQNGRAIAVSELWQNLGSSNFSLITNSGLPAIAHGYVAAGDFDNDGKKDLVLSVSGHTSVILLRNLGGGIFTNLNATMTGFGPAFMVDFDNDGYPDLLVGTKFWKNMGNGTFTNIASGLPSGALAVADFDNDGHPDVVIANGTYQIWRNLGNGTFTNMNVALPVLPSPSGLYGPVAAAGDYDNDGLPDIVLQTGDYYTPSAQVYRNLGNGVFTNVQAISGAMQGSLCWGDFNQDGQLDFVMTGFKGLDSHGVAVFVAQLWQNALNTSNAPPTAPTNLTAQIKGNGGVQLNWGAATDDHTPTAGLNYNIRVGSASGGVDIVSPEANQLTGQRLVVQIGNAQERLFSLLTNLTGGTYYWSVQAIDTAFAGGAFATESTFVIPPTINGFIYTNGQFQVAFNALATNSYTLQGSTNLTQWSSLTNLVPLTNGPAQLTDLNAASFPLRYYRLSCP